MPKMKTRKSVAKRIKVTGSGKILTSQSFQNHKRSAKSKRARREFSEMHEAARGVARRVRLRVPGLKARH